MLGFASCAFGQSLIELPLADLAGPAGRIDAQVGSYSVVLETADDPRAPKVWEGPVSVAAAGKDPSCRIDTELVTRAFADSAGTAVLLVSQSGSTDYVQAFALADCRPLWNEIAFAGGSISVAGNRIETEAKCEATGRQDVYRCVAARSFVLSHDFADMTADEERARQETLRRVGIAFEGSREIYKPGTPAARLAEEAKD